MKYNIEKDIPKDETKNSPFWICWHAGMLFLHGVITYQAFENIYNKYSGL
jgi:hypothetical protein